MRVHTSHAGLDSAACGTCLAIGHFDGVHLGHRAVIAKAANHATETGSPLGVLTFDPSPVQHFNPDTAPAHLMSHTQRERAFADQGVDHLFVLPFDGTLAAMSPDEFVQQILVDALRTRAVAVGANFRFGRKRKGDCRTLVTLGEQANVAVLVAPLAHYEGARVSSSLIRSNIASGGMAAAAALLGRSWIVEARVQRGLELGRGIGFPTANLDLGDYARPEHGVYAVWAAPGSERRWYPAVANYGRAPTMGGRSPLLEIHLFDFEANLYDETLAVAFIDHIRAERTFDSVEALTEQIASDGDAARAILGRGAPPPLASAAGMR